MRSYTVKKSTIGSAVSQYICFFTFILFYKIHKCLLIIVHFVESSPKPETREAVPETHEDEDSNSGGETNNEAEINTDTADGSQQQETNCAGKIHG